MITKEHIEEEAKHIHGLIHLSFEKREEENRLQEEAERRLKEIQQKCPHSWGLVVKGSLSSNYSYSICEVCAIRIEDVF